MFERKIIKTLKHWQGKKDRKPLVLRGARQVGKTTVINIFAKNFENYIALNLEKGEDKRIFDESRTVHEIFQAILIIKNINLKKGNTLLFIDEIQSSYTAIKMLRYFYEELPDIFVIAAGSLLELMMQKQAFSFPVGRVEFLYMYPLDFMEFLAAKGENKIIKVLEQQNILEPVHEKILKLFNVFTLVGGMPEVIQKYIQDENYINLRSVYESLLQSYIADSEKYVARGTSRTVLRHCLEIIPFEAGQRIKFQGFGKSNYKSREISEALKIIERAMLIYLIYPTLQVKAPIVEDRRKVPKLQYLDTGLLNYFAGLQPEFFKVKDLNDIYRGIIAEHIVRQELISIDPFNNKKILFWARDKKQSSAELDIILQYEGKLIPIEVKSGKAGTLKSLHQFINYSHVNFAIRFYSGKFELNETKTPEGTPYRLLNLPLYAAGNIYSYIQKYI